MKTNTTTSLACQIKGLDSIYYQEVYRFRGDKQFLYAVNILIDNHIVKKIRLSGKEQITKINTGRAIAMEYINDALTGNGKRIF